MFLTDLAVAARKSGLTVIELDGWKTRGRPASVGGFTPRGVLCHHTGDGINGINAAKGVPLQGRADLPGPLAQLSLDRQGFVYVIAAGRANHAGSVKAFGGWVTAGDGNSQMIGIEAQNSGSEGWTTEQLNAYYRLCAALCDHYGWSRARVAGHGEVSTAGKWDPGIRVNGTSRMIDMGEFRRLVGGVKLDGPVDVPPKPVIAQTTIVTLNWAAKAKAWQRATWARRLPAGAELLNHSGADIIALQEAGSMAYVKQIDRVLGFARAPGAGGPLFNRWRYLYFNPKTHKCLTSGLVSLNRLHTKHAAWGLFRNLATGKDLFVTSVHLTAGGASTEKTRHNEAVALLKATTKLNATGAPVVHAGDYNSGALIVEDVMLPGGLKDTRSTADRTINAYLDSNPGWDIKAKRQNRNPADGWHLDHVCAQAGVDTTTWELLSAPRVSDHNPIRVTIRY